MMLFVSVHSWSIGAVARGNAALDAADGPAVVLKPDPSWEAGMIVDQQRRVTESIPRFGAFKVAPHVVHSCRKPDACAPRQSHHRVNIPITVRSSSGSGVPLMVILTFANPRQGIPTGVGPGRNSGVYEVALVGDGATSSATIPVLGAVTEVLKWASLKAFAIRRVGWR